jgi:hypothetical protein
MHILRVLFQGTPSVRKQYSARDRAFTAQALTWLCFSGKVFMPQVCRF